jgi:hypothetical protein
MPFSDFLWNGAPPPSVTTESNQQGNMPLWYSQYTQGLLNRASAVAGEPFQVYPGQRIAGFTDPQQQAFQNAQNTARDWQPAMQGAMQATQSGAQPFDQGNLQQYLSPYLSGVTGEIERQGWRNFDTNVSDRLRSEFVGSGQMGSERHMGKFNEAAADTQREILGQSALANQRGYEAAMGDYGKWQDRSLTAGQNLANMAGQQQTLDTRTSAGLEAVGAQQQAMDQANLNLGYQDFVEQRDYPRQNVAFMNAAMRGLQVPTQTSTYNASPYQGQMAPSGLSQLASIYGLGMGS